jgi:hypothetical protein
MVADSVHGVGVPHFLSYQKQQGEKVVLVPNTPGVTVGVSLCTHLLCLVAHLTFLSNQSPHRHLFCQQNTTVVCAGTSGGLSSIHWHMHLQRLASVFHHLPFS